MAGAISDGAAQALSWLAYPLEAVYTGLGRSGQPVEIVCELVTGGRIEPGTEAGLRVVRVVPVERQAGMPVCYHLLVDHSPEGRDDRVRVWPGGSCCGKDANRA